jgi:hypothetical protein
VFRGVKAVVTGAELESPNANRQLSNVAGDALERRGQLIHRLLVFGCQEILGLIATASTGQRRVVVAMRCIRGRRALRTLEPTDTTDRDPLSRPMRLGRVTINRYD